MEAAPSSEDAHESGNLPPTPWSPTAPSQEEADARLFAMLGMNASDLWHYAYRCARRLERDEAFDIAQDVSVSMLLRTYKRDAPPVLSPKSFVYKAVLREAQAIWNRKKVHLVPLDEQPEQSDQDCTPTDVQAIENIEDEQLTRAIARLQNRQTQQLLELIYKKNLSVRAAAKHLNIPATTAQSRFKAALRDIRRDLRQLGRNLRESE